MRSATRAWSASLSLLTVLAAAATARAAAIDSAPYSADELVQLSLASNPQVRSAEAEYQAALHQVDQVYTPSDPQFSYGLSQTPNGFTKAQTKTIGLSDTFQFPGKAWLQGDQAHRNAEIARLAFQAAARDARAQALTAYYQTLLDSAAVSIAVENTASISQVLQVVKVAYAASQAAQSDLISAEIGLAQSSHTIQISQTAEANDEASLNQAIGREPETPIALADGMELKPLELPLPEVKDQALANRQEILEAALTERNSKTALKLAWMEFLPDFGLSWAKNSYPTSSINSVQPGSSYSDYNTSISFNLPVFFWFRQKEDIRAAGSLLDAARQNRKSVELQALTTVVQLYRSTNLAYQTAQLNKELLIPLAYQDFRVALVAYQSKKVDFLTLSNALQGIYNARTNYLTAANQFLAGKVALEQAIGAPLK